MKWLVALGLLPFVALPLVARAQPAPSPLASFAALQGVALTQTDLPGYTLQSEMPTIGNSPPPPGVVAAYNAEWTSESPPSVLAILLLQTDSVSTARIAYNAFAQGASSITQASNFNDAGSQGIGDQDDVQSFKITAKNVTAQGSQAVARAGTVVALVLEIAGPSTGTQQDAVTDLRTMVTRIQAATGAGGSPAPAGGPAPAAPASLTSAQVLQGLIAMVQQYAAQSGVSYAGDCGSVSAANAGALCTVFSGPDASGVYTISYSLVGADGTPGAPYGTQAVTLDQIAAALAAQAQPSAAPAPGSPM